MVYEQQDRNIFLSASETRSRFSSLDRLAIRLPQATMSILPPDVHAELTQLLQALQSADNSIRSQAEDHLQNNWTTTRPEVLLMGLAEQIQNAADASVRHALNCSAPSIPRPSV